MPAASASDDEEKRGVVKDEACALAHVGEDAANAGVLAGNGNVGIFGVLCDGAARGNGERD